LLIWLAACIARFSQVYATLFPLVQIQFIMRLFPGNIALFAP
jgi:hypothetical protein